jgi:NADH-quinone oxidoreductase subunit C
LSSEPETTAKTALSSAAELLGDAVLAAEADVVRVDRASWKQAVATCRDRLHMDYFCFLSGIDWLPNPQLSGEKAWDPDASPAEEAPFQAGVAGGATRFQVFARLYSTRSHEGITLKADLDNEAPSVESITSLYRGADWHEREAWEMYGFDFVGHPRLRHLYLPGAFEGFPLRKDFPLLAREVKPWPGIVDVEAMPGVADDPADDPLAAVGDEAEE